MRAWHRAPVEIVYTSSPLQKLSSRPGLVIESPIDLARFTPARRRDPHPFRVGRLSRDVVSKHHDEDPAVYAALAADGIELRIMGGTCLRDLPGGPVEGALLPAGAEPAIHFLQDLDCFYYRTSERWLEAYGRVVFEAMACGLPVVCGRRGGYADYIVHGVNGFLFDTSVEALALIRTLRDDVALRERIGRAARATVEQLYAGSAWRQKQAYFLRTPTERRPSDAFDPVPSELH